MHAEKMQIVQILNNVFIIDIVLVIKLGLAQEHNFYAVNYFLLF